MAVTLFFRSTRTADYLRYSGGGPSYKDMLATRGSGVTNALVNTAAGGTNIGWTDGAGGNALAFISPPLDQDVLMLTTDVQTFNIWAQESSMNANCGGRARLYKISDDNDIVDLGFTFDDGVEFGFSGANTVFNWTGSVGTNTQFRAGDRIGCRIFITNVGGTMAGGFTCTLGYNGTTGAANGDSFVTLNATGGGGSLQFDAEPSIDSPLSLYGNALVRKPSLGTIVRPGHQLAPDYAYLLQEGFVNTAIVRDYGTHGIPMVQNVPNMSMSPFRVPEGLYISATAGPHVLDQRKLLKGTAVTLVFSMAMQYARTGGRFLGSAPLDGVSDCYMGLSAGSASSGTGDWGFGNTTLSTGAGVNFIFPSIWVLTAGTRGMEIWRQFATVNGIGSNTALKLVASTGTVPTFTPGNTDFAIGRINAGSNPNFRIGFLYIYNRQLSKEEVDWVTTDPFAPFVRGARKLSARGPAAPTVGYAFFPPFVTVNPTTVDSGGLTPSCHQPPEVLSG